MQYNTVNCANINAANIYMLVKASPFVMTDSPQIQLLCPCSSFLTEIGQPLPPRPHCHTCRARELVPGRLLPHCSTWQNRQASLRDSFLVCLDNRLQSLTAKHLRRERHCRNPAAGAPTYCPSVCRPRHQHVPSDRSRAPVLVLLLVPLRNISWIQCSGSPA